MIDITPLHSGILQGGKPCLFTDDERIYNIHGITING